jgi:murein DD-endopeptidase MepM/ murein hydrolase activator NlpD
MAREREEKKGLKVQLAGLAGFALGAATVLLVVWLYRREAPPAPVPVPAAPPAAVHPQPETRPITDNRPAPPTSGGAQRQSPEPGPPPANPAPVDPASLPADLARRGLLVPVAGVARSALLDTFDDARSEGRVHDAIDIMAPRGTPVVAVEAGRIVKLFNSERGGLTAYQFDPTESYCYYYAHLDRYAPDLREGMLVARGQLIGTVGFTGNASPEGPHLHFAITRLNEDKKWWQGQPLNPYPILRQGP